MAIVSLLAVMSVPALSGLSSSGKIQQSVGQMASLLGIARSLAVTQNTYVYVFLRPDTSAGQVRVLLVSSQTGLDVFQDTSGTLDLQGGSALRLARSPITLDGVRLVKKGEVPPDKVARPQSTGTVDLGSDYRVILRSQTFDRAVVFRPTGEAAQSQSDGVRASLGYAGLTEFALEPSTFPGAEGSSPLASVLQVVGSTGQTKVYRAQ